VTIQPLSLDEMSKLWSSFQTPYRLSVAYEVGVVLIESGFADESPLPVLRRGEGDLGWDSTTQFPMTLVSARFKSPMQPGMRLGEELTLLGSNLNPKGQVQVVFRHPSLSNPLLVTPLGITGNEITLTIPDDVDDWPAGIYMVGLQNTVSVGGNDHSSFSNAIPVALLPEVIVPPVPPGLQTVPSGNELRLNVPCKPKLRLGQSVQVLIGSICINKVNVANPARPVAEWVKNSVQFPIGERRAVRLRVDGVESLIYDPLKPDQGFESKYIVQNLP
jgi:hypothetical protein